MKIRPCIDIHNGRVKQIVGSTLTDSKAEGPAQNFVSSRDADYYASIYREKNLPGGHIILLNPSSDQEAYSADLQQAELALKAYPGGMQIGGGVTASNAADFLRMGASHVIVTSFVFREGRLDRERLQALQQAAGREHLVLDLSCRRIPDGRFMVVTDRWQKLTDMQICADTLDALAEHCDEFLIHAADVEGKKAGIQEDLVRILGSWQQKSNFPVTYAGGVHALTDIDRIAALSGGRMDVTVGSALDLFGGSLGLDELAERTHLAENM
jgi:phosphoribosylformimino-5-aminoimidazole carboxamide ribotide isomerase